MQTHALTILSFIAVAAADLMVAPSLYAGDTFLLFDTASNYITRKFTASVGDETVPWNRSLTPQEAVESDKGLFAVGRDQKSGASVYYWQNKTVRPLGCPSPADARFVFADTFYDVINLDEALPALLLEPATGAVFSVNVSTNNTVKCYSTFLSLSNNAIPVIDVTFAFGYVWHVMESNGWITVVAPKINVRTEPLFRADAGVVCRLTVTRDIDGRNRLILFVGDLPADLNDALAQNSNSVYGKLIEINRNGAVATWAGGLCNPVAVTLNGFHVVVADDCSMQQEVNVLEKTTLFGQTLNFGWPMIEGNQGRMVFTREKPISSVFIKPVMTSPVAVPDGYNFTEISIYIMLGLAIFFLATLCFRAAVSPAAMWQDVVTGATILVIIGLQLPTLIVAPGYNASASLYGVDQSKTFHPAAWTGSFMALTIMATGCLVVAIVGPTRQRWVATGLAAGILSVYAIILGGGVRKPWQVAWEGWFLGALSAGLLVAALMVQPKTEYEQI